MSNYISYAWYTSKQSGFGGINITEPRKIASIGDVQDITKWLSDEMIKDKYGEKANCVVLSFQEYQSVCSKDSKIQELESELKKRDELLREAVRILEWVSERISINKVEQFLNKPEIRKYRSGE